MKGAADMAVTIDELIKQILALYDDLPDDEVMEEIYRSIFGGGGQGCKPTNELTCQECECPTLHNAKPSATRG